MYETGKDMDPKYRETSCGGLALQVVAELERGDVPTASDWMEDVA